ncbi:MAG TPA: hypothetical protein VH599_18030 [Ktedonobacterales bacterium]|jgi:hypothetical protein
MSIETEVKQMSLDKQLEELLAGLGVEMEREAEEPADEDGDGDGGGVRLANISLFQASKEHYGVFYRLDLIECCPQLRVFLPANSGAAKMEGYLVCPAEHSPLRGAFELLAAHEGSPDFEMQQDTMRQHQLFAVGEMMKRLFWAGDLEEMQFPAEVLVERIL